MVLCAVGAIGAIGLERVRKIGDLFGQIADVLLQLVEDRDLLAGGEVSRLHPALVGATE